MNANKKEPTVAIKRTKSRYIMIREDIHEALDLYSMSLYMAFRYEADYAQEDAVLKRSVKFLYEKAKISRRQFFISMNILEDHGLILREQENQYQSISTYHVAQELGYFNTNCGVVHDVHGVVHDVHTNHYSLPESFINKTISGLEEKEKAVTVKEIIEAYHEELPDNPKIKVIDQKLEKQLKAMVKKWPKYQKEGKKFSIESFKDYLRLIKSHYSWFIRPYFTEGGRERRNNLRTLTTDTIISKFINGEFSRG